MLVPLATGWNMQKISIKTMITLISFSSLGLGFLGPVYSIFVVKNFQASLFHAGLLSAIFLLTSALFKMPAGKLVDKYGKWKILFIGLIGCGVSSLFYIFAFDILHLYVIEFIYGVSFAFQRPALLALMAVVSNKPSRGMLLGVFDSVDDISGAFAAVVSGAVVSSLGFNTLFIICFTCYIISGLFILKTRQKIN
jgi:DHA1 family multidrug resistance protein-like MFS transporter